MYFFNYFILKFDVKQRNVFFLNKNKRNKPSGLLKQIFWCFLFLWSLALSYYLLLFLQTFFHSIWIRPKKWIVRVKFKNYYRLFTILFRRTDYSYQNNGEYRKCKMESGPNFWVLHEQFNCSIILTWLSK